MAVTQDDLDALIAARMRGVAQVRFSDGRQVIYRTDAEMEKAIAFARAELATAGDGSRTTYISVARE